MGAIFSRLRSTTDGSWTFTLIDQLDHHTVATADNLEGFLLAPIDLSGLVVATDGDGDTLTLAAETFTVDVKDDIPIDFSPADSTLSNAAGTVEGDLDAVGKIGADEPMSIVFTNVVNGAQAMGSIAGGAATQLSSSGLDIFLYNFGGVIVGTTQVISVPGDVVAIGDLDAGQFVFTVTLDPDVGNDKYIFELLAPIDNGSGITLITLLNWEVRVTTTSSLLIRPLEPTSLFSQQRWARRQIQQRLAHPSILASTTSRSAMQRVYC